MKEIPYIDLHQDIAGNTLYVSEKDLLKKNKLHEGKNEMGLPVNNQVDLPRLKESGARCIFATSFSAGLLSKDASRGECSLKVLEQLNFYHELLNNAEQLGLVKNHKGYKFIKNNKKIGLILHLEGAEMLDENLIYLDTLYWLGVRSIGFTHNNKNRFAGGAMSSGGLTKKGERLIERISELNMITDLAHLNKKSLNEALKTVNPPFMFSHGGIRVDKRNPRNLTEEQAVKIAEKGGVIGVTFAPSMLSSPKIETVADIFKHLKELVGAEALAIGSDFDGITSKELTCGLEDVSKMPNLVRTLKERGFKKNEIEKIFYGNVEKRLIEAL